MRILLLTLALFFTSCYGTYYLSDAEYSDVRESHSSLTYWNNQIYWGWDNGWYYYYGKPHYYPWYYYYNTCPPSIYNTVTHVVIINPANKPNRPNRPNWNNNRPNRPNNNNKVIINKNRNNKVNINRSTNNKKKKRR